MSAGSDYDDRHGTAPPGRERLFVAWEPDRGTLDALARAAAAWRECSPAAGLRWQHGDQLHLTLRFLGATGAQQRAGIEAGLAALARRCGRCWAQALRFEAWPSPRAPRVLVLELAPDRALAELATALETLARDCGFPGENRRFRPHFTLARARAGSHAPGPPPSLPHLAVRVDALHLVRSTPGPSGSRYETVAAFPLAP